MKKVMLELTEPELKVIVSALKYAKAYKGMEAYETVLKRIVEQLKAGVSKYYVVQGISDDGICRCSRAILVRAPNSKYAAYTAKDCLEGGLGESFTPVAVSEATKNYGVCEVL